MAHFLQLRDVGQGGDHQGSHQAGHDLTAELDLAPLREGPLNEEQKFTLEELAKYNGKNGQRAYVAFGGRVYDVTDSALWQGGDHQGSHQAGHDLTAELDLAPHGPENLELVKPVGVLV
jgi:predicted heme/steroid binding protein